MRLVLELMILANQKEKALNSNSWRISQEKRKRIDLFFNENLLDC